MASLNFGLYNPYYDDVPYVSRETIAKMDFDTFRYVVNGEHVPGYCPCTKCVEKFLPTTIIDYESVFDQCLDFKARDAARFEVAKQKAKNELLQKDYKPSGTQKATRIVYLTINPPMFENAFQNLQTFVNDLVTHRLVEEYLYSFELNTTEGRCPHVHIYLTVKAPYEKSLKAIKTSYKTGALKKGYLSLWNGATPTNNQFCWLYCADTAADKQKLIQYVVKEGTIREKKHIKAEELTLEWREANEILNYYTNIEDLNLYGITKTQGGDNLVPPPSTAGEEPLDNF